MECLLPCRARAQQLQQAPPPICLKHLTCRTQHVAGWCGWVVGQCSAWCPQGWQLWPAVVCRCELWRKGSLDMCGGGVHDRELFLFHAQSFSIDGTSVGVPFEDCCYPTWLQLQLAVCHTGTAPDNTLTHCPDQPTNQNTPKQTQNTPLRRNTSVLSVALHTAAIHTRPLC